MSHLGLAFVLMLRPFFPELVMSTDLLSFEHPSVLLFCLLRSTLTPKTSTLKMTSSRCLSFWRLGPISHTGIDDVLSINNPEFDHYLGQMYPVELEIKYTTESNTSASYLDLLLSVGRDGQLHTSIYDKRNDFNFHITNFPFLSSNLFQPRQPMASLFRS